MDAELQDGQSPTGRELQDGQSPTEWVVSTEYKVVNSEYQVQSTEYIFSSITSIAR